MGSEATTWGEMQRLLLESLYDGTENDLLLIDEDEWSAPKVHRDQAAGREEARPGPAPELPRLDLERLPLDELIRLEKVIAPQFYSEEAS